ncbi:hypothetical protein D3C74_238940 [compost metagenome]
MHQPQSFKLIFHNFIITPMSLMSRNLAKCLATLVLNRLINSCKKTRSSISESAELIKFLKPVLSPTSTGS